MSAPTHLLFAGHELLEAGDLLTVAMACRANASSADLLVFEMASGRQIDLDVRGSQAALARRYGSKDSRNDPATPATQEPGSPQGDGQPRGRGRPKLGVVGREVTLLPRHWAWLDEQRGGASAALRRLVDGARRDLSGADLIRSSQDRTNRFLSAIAGNLPGFEEATRALFNSDASRFKAETRNWPRDVRRYALEFAKDALRGDVAA
ncbi:MAG: DUF2239 family protein [Pseudomonadales bacterium]|nr:DUF2239 family protein [Pseudomonadales bacterium]